MAYTKTVWVNNTTPAIHASNLNKMEQGIKDAHTVANVKTWYESNDDTNVYTDSEKTLVGTIDSINTRVETLENSGMTALIGSNLTPQTIPITAVKVTSFDTIGVDVGVGTGGSIVDQRAIAELDGVFKFRYEAFVSYASNVDIEWHIYKNGVSFGAPITISGQGATYFPILRLGNPTLLADDYVELYATASAETDITILQASGTLEKTHF